jgi:hypothetical protein
LASAIATTAARLIAARSTTHVDRSAHGYDSGPIVMPSESGKQIGRLSHVSVQVFWSNDTPVMTSTHVNDPDRDADAETEALLPSDEASETLADELLTLIDDALADDADADILDAELADAELADEADDEADDDCETLELLDESLCEDSLDEADDLDELDFDDADELDRDELD